MKIVIIGDGKVGHKLTIQLSEENYDVVLIDQNEGKLKEALNQLIFSALPEMVQMRKCRKKQECRALILLWHVHRQTN